MKRKYILGLAVGLLAGVAPAQLKKMDNTPPTQAGLVCEHDYSGASARVLRFEFWHKTFLLFRIRGAKPNHLHTAWLGLNGPSPLSGAAAAPLVPTSGIQRVIDNADTASAAGANAFYTNSRGNAWVFIPLDFRMSGGVYPFSKFDGSLADVGIDNPIPPFTIAVGVHCDDPVPLQHGLVPQPFFTGTFTVEFN